MYSKNDYRYYLEKQLMHSDDSLAHYGVKGMKWKKHVRKGVITTSDIALNAINKDRLSDAEENIEAIRDNMRHPYVDPTGRNTRHNANQFASNTTQVISSVAKRDVETISSSVSKKKKKKSNRKPFTIESLRRVKPKGKKLKGGGGITVTHNTVIK